MHLKKENLVYIDCRHYDGSGIGTYIENLIKQYQHIPTEYAISLLTRKNYSKSDLQFSKFNKIAYDEPIYSLKEQYKWISKISPSGLLHVPHYNAPLLFPGKLIVTVHDICHVVMRHYFPGILKKVYSTLFLRQILRKSDHIITVSNFSKSEIRRYFNIPGNKISVIYNGVNSIFNPICQEEAQGVIQKYKLPTSYLLFLGNIKPHKNIGGLIDSYQKALAQNSKIPPLVMLGRYSKLSSDVLDSTKRFQKLQANGKIIFPGYLPTQDLPAIYSQAKIFLFPSFYEGFGLPVIEAMACGTPVIASNCSAIPEIAGQAAVLVDPHNSMSLAHCIVQLDKDRNWRMRLIQKGLAHAKQYSWKKAAMEHLKIYRQIQVKALPPFSR